MRRRDRKHTPTPAATAVVMVPIRVLCDEPTGGTLESMRDAAVELVMAAGLRVVAGYAPVVLETRVHTGEPQL